MTQSEVRRYLIKTLKGFEKRELENLIGYYLDAKQEEVMAGAMTEAQLVQDVKALNEGKPVQYVTGISFFYGHRFRVRPGCLIPRPETEELVHWVVEDYKTSADLKVLDIGVGSGCILLSIMKALSQRGVVAYGYGLDVSAAAIEIFRHNAEQMSIEAHSIVGDILQKVSLPIDCDVIISNPPYILDTEKGRMDTSVIDYEPKEALFVKGSDPLVFYKRIMKLGMALLKTGGAIYFETSDLYHSDMVAAIDNEAYASEFRKDMSGNWRMLKLTKRQLS